MLLLVSRYFHAVATVLAIPRNLSAVDVLVIEVPGHIPVRMLQAVHQVGTAGIVGEESTNGAHLCPQHSLRGSED